MGEKTPTNKDKKKEITKRTNSPAQRKSPQLKRQSSRTSLFKQSDDDFEDISDIEEDDKIPRRSARGDKETIEGKAVTPKRSSRSGSNMKTDTKPEKVSETEEEEDEKKTEMARASTRLKGPNTPTKKNKQSSDSDDPYVFQEPEPLESSIKSETPESPSNIEDESFTRRRTIEQKEGMENFIVNETLTKTEDDVNEEIEKLEENSSDPPEEVMQILTPVKDIEEEDLSTQNNTLVVKDEQEGTEIKQEKTDGEKGVKPVLQLTDRYASLFPHLAALRAAPTTASTITAQNTISSSSDAEFTSIQITSANIISSIVESSILKETISTENKSSASQSEVKSEDSEKEKGSNDGSGIGIKEELQDEDKKDIKLFKESQSPTKPRTRNKKSKKVRSLRNPTHKSREVVTDSDTDSDDEKPKVKPITPRRKT